MLSRRSFVSSKTKHLVWTLVGIFCGAFGTAMPVLCADNAYPEDPVKAAFLFRFTSYVDWPSDQLNRSQFTIAVLGSKAVAEELKKFLPAHTIKNLPAQVRTISSLRELGDAQVLYIGTDYAGRIRPLIDELASKPVLIVTDHPRGLDNGSMVNFILMNRRVRFEISLTAANRAGIKMGSGLLSVAARVRGAPLRSGAECAPMIMNDKGTASCMQRVAQL